MRWSTWNFLPMILGNCVSTALLSRLSRLLGSGERQAARRLHRRAQWFMLWFGLVVGLASALPAASMVDVTGLDAHVADDAVHYLVVSNLGCVPMFVLMQTTAAMRAAGEALVPLLLLLLANLLNLGLDLVLMFGWEPLGVPALGVVGAAYASVAARAVAAVLALAWLRRRSHPVSLRAVPPARVSVALPLLRDAWPQVLQIGLRAGMVVVLTIVVQRRFGDAPTAALGITTRLDTVILFAALGFANAATAFAGRAVAVGRAGAARAAGLWAAALAGGFGLAVLLAMQHWSTELVACFLPHAPPAVQAATDLYLATAGWSQVLGAVALGAIGAVHGAGRMVSPLLVDLFGFTVLCGWFARVVLADLPPDAVYGSLVVGMAAVAALHLGFVLVGRWPRRL
jgi:putative MATE family efflux protein